MYQGNVPGQFNGSRLPSTDYASHPNYPPGFTQTGQMSGQQSHQQQAGQLPGQGMHQLVQGQPASQAADMQHMPYQQGASVYPSNIMQPGYGGSQSSVPGTYSYNQGLIVNGLV